MISGRKRSTYARDVWACARFIYWDLSRGKALTAYRELVWLCEKHGGPPLPDPSVSSREGAIYRDGRIHVCTSLELAEYLEAIPHELVHRLADTERWRWLNGIIDGWAYDRYDFREDCARVVGRLFVRAFRREERRAVRTAAAQIVPDVLRDPEALDALTSVFARRGITLDRHDLLVALEKAAHTGQFHAE